LTLATVAAFHPDDGRNPTPPLFLRAMFSEWTLLIFDTVRGLAAAAMATSWMVLFSPWLMSSNSDVRARPITRAKLIPDLIDFGASGLHRRPARCRRSSAQHPSGSREAAYSASLNPRGDSEPRQAMRYCRTHNHCPFLKEGTNLRNRKLRYVPASEVRTQRALRCLASSRGRSPLGTVVPGTPAAAFPV